MTRHDIEVARKARAMTRMVAPGDDDGWQHAARLWPAEPTQLRLDGGPWHGEMLTLHGPAGEAPTAISVGGICWPRLASP